MVTIPDATNPNAITLQSYNTEVKRYIQYTPATYQSHHAPLLRWIDTTLSFLNKDDQVLEIGSGFGRDASYISLKGYRVKCTDGAAAFVDYLRARGWNAQPLNILDDDIPSGFSLIFANAVLPHFTPSQFELILNKTLKALPPKGMFAFSVKQGWGEKWITEKFEAKRFIHYWDPQLLKECLERTGSKIVFWEEGIPGDLPTHTWTNVTVQKI